MLSLFLVPGGEAAALQRVPLPGRGQGKPHSEYFGSTGQRVNGQESGGLPIPAHQHWENRVVFWG